MPELTPAQFAHALDVALRTEAGEKILLAQMNRLFEDGKWEIPDDAVAGHVTHKVDQLEASVKSLTSLLGQLAAEVRGETAKPGVRVDAIASVKPSKNK